MPQRIGSAVTGKVVQRLAAATALDGAPVVTLNVPAEMAEKSDLVKYPSVNVYCEGIANELHEKFRSFSGKVHMAIEVRYSQDRLEGLQDQLELYLDGAMGVLNTSRGDWADGMFYGGEYEISIGPVKKGGRNFIQTAKITFEIGVSRN
jgi:hypothetical protein